MKKNKLPSLVVVAVLTLITAIMWISFNIYRSLVAKPSPVVPSEISNPLNPNLDVQTLNLINSKIFFDESQIPEVAAVPTATPTQQLIATPSPSPIPTEAPNEVATQSGEPI